MAGRSDSNVKSRSRTGRYTRANRIALRRELDAVFDEGRVFRFPAITVRALPNGRAESRLGLVVGRRHGCAVRRNRMKRLLREAFRLNRTRLGVACDLVVTPTSGWTDLRLAAIEPMLVEALARVEKTLAGPS